MKIGSDFKVNYLETMTPETMNYMIDYSNCLDEHIKSEEKKNHKTPAERKNISRFKSEYDAVGKFILDCQLQLITLKYKNNENK